MATYTPGQPPNGSSLGSTRDLIRNNIDGIYQRLGVDHITNNLAGAGKHNQVTSVAQAADPVTNATENAIYCKLASGINELFMRRSSNGSVIQLTSGTPISATTGFTYLPGTATHGLRLLWGISAGVANNGTITVAAATTLLQATITINDSSVTPNSRAYIASIAGNIINIKVPTGGTVDLSYIAIGF